MFTLGRIIVLAGWLAVAALTASAVAGAARAQERQTWFDLPLAGGDDALSSLLDADVQPAALFQPAPPAQPAAPARPVRRQTAGSQQANIRLASVPNMFGDFAGVVAVAGVIIQNANGQQVGVKSQFGIPTAGIIRTGKIAENDTPIPVDRVFFSYNHFNDLFEISEQASFPPGAPALIRQQPFDRYTVGFEKTFLNGLFSVEMRLPFNGTYDVNLQTFGIDGGNVGNLAVVIKSLLYSDQNLAVGAGMAIGTPTGSDTVTRVGLANLRFQNEATHLLPYIGFIYSPGDPSWGWGNGLFLTGFGQVDLAASGNPVRVGPANDPSAPGQQIGTFTEQNLLFLDLAVGYWAYRNPDAERLTGLAGVAEFHYTSAMQDADALATTVGNGAVSLRNPINRFDVVNFTAGIQALLFDASSLRVGYAVPLGGRADQRLFGSEVQVQFNRRF